MLHKSFVIFFLICLIRINKSNGELKLIQTLTRHGARYPVDSSYSLLYYPNDPNKNATFEPDGPMELTLKGKMESYKLGLFLRKRYNKFLTDRYNPKEVYFHSVRLSRTIMTAQLMAFGLYSPSVDQVWHSSIPLIPIPIHSQDVFKDKLNFAMALCDNYKADKKIARKQVLSLVNMIDRIQEMFALFSNHTGVKHNNTMQGWMMYHQLVSQKSLNLTLEPWAEKILNDGSLLQFASIEYITQTYTDRMKRIVGGIWIKQFLDHIDHFLHHQINNPKAFFYATNELQITGLLHTLGVYKAPHVPSYCNTIIFEYHLIEEKSYVKIVYKDKNKILDLRIGNCNVLCPLDKFKKILRNVTLDNFDEDCGRIINFNLFI